MSRTTLLTGATDGIGLALARLWRGRGELAYLHGRRPLAELDPELFDSEHYCPADLTRLEAPAEIAAFLEQRGVDALDRLVLNAGIGWFGAPEDQTPDNIRDLVQVNLWSPMELCHRLLPKLRKARGRVVLVSSVSSALPCPNYAVYGAVKAAKEGFARSLRIELADEVEVQVIRPGATRTGIHAKSGIPKEAVDWTRFPPAERVAAAIDRALVGAPHWITVGTGTRIMRMAGRNLPRLVDRMQARSVSR